MSATIELFGHPFSSYTWKALIPLWEKQVDFTFRALGPDEAENGARFGALWPVGQFPLLVEDGDRALPESSAIIERLDRLFPTPRLIPDDPDAALEVRLLDRVFDNQVMNLLQPVVLDAIKPEERRDPVGVEQVKSKVHRSYAWLDARLAGRTWAAGEDFTLADCAAAPSLFYADWIERIPEELATLRGYRARLLARPSVKRAVDEARPHRHLFPLGAPDRD